MRGWINIYRSGFWHPRGKPGAVDLHGGDVYMSRADALKAIAPMSHYVDTIAVDFRDPDAESSLIYRRALSAAQSNTDEENVKNDIGITH